MEYKTPKEILKEIPQNLANGENPTWKTFEKEDCDIIYTTPREKQTQYKCQTYVMVNQGETEFVTKDFDKLVRYSADFVDEKEYIDFILFLHDDDIVIDNFYWELCYKINDWERLNFLEKEDYDLFSKYTEEIDLDKNFIFSKAKWAK